MDGRGTIGHYVGEASIVACNAGLACFERLRNLLMRPPVNTISTAQLVRDYLHSDRSAFVLIDVRSPAERSVSTIPGAITREAYESDPSGFAEKTIVPYCTIGGRSYMYAHSLATRGVSVANYRDSILGWVRAGLPLESAEGKPTKKIHPYWRLFTVPSDYEIETLP